MTDLVVESRITNFLDVNLVRLLEDLDLIARDRPEDTDSEPRTGEGMTLDQVVGDGEKTTEGTDLV